MVYAITYLINSNTIISKLRNRSRIGFNRLLTSLRTTVCAGPGRDVKDGTLRTLGTHIRAKPLHCKKSSKYGLQFYVYRTGIKRSEKRWQIIPFLSITLSLPSLRLAHYVLIKLLSSQVVRMLA